MLNLICIPVTATGVLHQRVSSSHGPLGHWSIFSRPILGAPYYDGAVAYYRKEWAFLIERGGPRPALMGLRCWGGGLGLPDATFNCSTGDSRLRNLCFTPDFTSVLISEFENGYSSPPSPIFPSLVPVPPTLPLSLFSQLSF